MGVTGSPYKIKSSKRKRDKISSQKKKKKNQAKESKKRRRYDSVSSYSDDDSYNSGNTLSSSLKSDYRRRINKVKKNRRDHSISSYSDDQSVSSDSDSLSTHDNGYKGRKGRRSRVHKSTKRRAQKRLSRSNGDADSEYERRRKRKRLSGSHVVKPRKKSSKKPKRQLSISSSSDSESCSTCRSRSVSSSSDSNHRKSKAMLDKEIERRRRRRRESYKARRKQKVKYPSCSSSGSGSDHSVRVSHNDGALAPVNTSRRLRSVIAFADKSNVESDNRCEKDPDKEEIVYDRDDFPSPKSPESFGGERIRESDIQSDGALNKMICGEKVPAKQETDIGKSGINEGHQNNASDHLSDGAHMKIFEKVGETDMSVPVAALARDDLESILRQKALENLRKFRGGLQMGPKSTANLKLSNESEANSSSTGRDDIVQNKPTEQVSSNTPQMSQSSGTMFKIDVSLPMGVQKLPESEINHEPEIVRQTLTHPPNGATVLGCPEEDKCASPRALLAEPVSKGDTIPGSGTTNASGSSTSELPSCVGPISGVHSLEEQKIEANDGFEQKTMSVMRGGEMVQVSYKVYIPKKPPPLSRRPLKR